MPPKFLSVMIMHVLTSRDENNVGPGQLGSFQARKKIYTKCITHACSHPPPTIYSSGRNVHLWHFPWPKCPWLKCPGQNVRGRNVHGRNVRAPSYGSWHGFWPSAPKTSLLCNTNNLEYWNFTWSKFVFYTVQKMMLVCNKVWFSHIKAHMGLITTKPVFGVSAKVRFKPACSATETS